MSTNSVANTPVSSIAGTSASISAVSTNSVLKQTKCQKSMHWWYFGPVLLAIVMFLLMGTIFERRIEALWRRILERRQAVLAQTAENSDPPLNTNSLHTVKTPSQRTIGSSKAGTTAITNDTDGKLEVKNFCCSYKKKEVKEEDGVKKEL